MSLFDDLSRCDQNPGQHWGRFSTVWPENGDVCLLSEEPKTMRNNQYASKLRQRNSSQNPIEIPDHEPEQPQSSKDRKPGEYVFQPTINFKIPKTKRETKDNRETANNQCETRRNCASKVRQPTQEGTWLRTGTKHSRSQQSSSTRRKNDPVKINRRFPIETESIQRSESEALDDIEQYESDESDDAKSDKKHKGENRLQEEYSEQSTSANTSKTSTGLDRASFFCDICGSAIAGKSCTTCGESVQEHTAAGDKPLRTKQQQNAMRPSRTLTLQFYGENANNAQGKTTQNSEKQKSEGKSSSQRRKSTGLLSGLLDGQVRLSAPKRKLGRKKTKKLNATISCAPELVRISSDEEELQPDADMGNYIESNHNMDVDMSCENRKTDLETTVQPSEISTSCNGLPLQDSNIAEIIKASSTQAKYPKAKVAKLPPASIDYFYGRDDITVEIPVDKIFIGRLCGLSQTPVVLNSEYLKIIVQYDEDTECDFTLKQRDFTSVKLSNHHPCYLVIEPTSGWARKMNERYAAGKCFIDPGSAACDERQILLMLTTSISSDNIGFMEELITDCFMGGKLIVSIINPEEASIELNRMMPSSHDTTNFLAKTNRSNVQTTTEPENRQPNVSTMQLRASISSQSNGKQSRTLQQASSTKQPRTSQPAQSSCSKRSQTSQPSNTTAADPQLSPPEIHVQNSPSPSTSRSGIVARKSYNTRSHSTAACTKKVAKKILTYPHGSKTGGVTITTEDVECLHPDTYLNDVIIDFFLKYLFEEELSEHKERSHVFSTFFYKRLTQKNGASNQRSPEVMHNLVRTWTKNVDLFSKDFIIVPINECSHWYLAIICFPGLVAIQQQQEQEKERQQRKQEELDVDDDYDDDSLPYSPSRINESLLCESNENGEETEQQPNEKKSDSDDDAFDEPITKSVLRTKRRGKPRTSKKSNEKIPMQKRPCILVFDSLSHTGRAQMLVNMRNYLTCEWGEKKSEEMSLSVIFDKANLKACFPKVPCQNNSSDCGVYLLQYVESFFKNPIQDYTFPISKRDWFSLDIIEDKRARVKELIHTLQKRANLEES